MTESKPSQVRPDASCDRSPVKAEETLSSVGLKEMVVELEMADLNFLVPDADRDTSALGSSAVQPAIDDERDGRPSVLHPGCLSWASLPTRFLATFQTRAAWSLYFAR